MKRAAAQLANKHHRAAPEPGEVPQPVSLSDNDEEQEQQGNSTDLHDMYETDWKNLPTREVQHYEMFDDEDYKSGKGSENDVDIWNRFYDS